MSITDRLRSYAWLIPFKVRLLLVPLLVTVMFLAVSIIEQKHISRQYSTIRLAVAKELNVLSRINTFESGFSIIFGNIHSLILSAGQSRNGGTIDEEYVYTHGKPLIYKLYKQKEFLNKIIIPLLKNKVKPSMLDEIKSDFGQYHHHASSAITMVSVDLELAGRQAADASTYYNRVLQSMAGIKKMLITKSEDSLNRHFDKVMEQTRSVTRVILFFIVLMILAALFISRQLSEDFEEISSAIGKLAKGERKFRLPSFRGNRELQKISNGLQVFRDNILKIEELHYLTLENNSRLRREIAEKKEALTKLALSDKVFENATEAIVISDAENRIIRVNKAFATITGYEYDEVIGKDPGFQKSGLYDDEFYRDMWHDIETFRHWQGEIVNKKKDGDLWSCWMTISMIEYEDTHYYVAVATDISPIKASQQKIEFLAYHDTLTSLPNRALFKDRVKHAISIAESAGRTLTMLYIDLDKFKYINDTMGHYAGDMLLVEVTRRLQSILGPEDTLSRFGGDEFLILLESIDKKEEMLLIVERLIEQFEKPFLLNSREITVSASIGVSFYPDDARDTEMMIKHADLAMYKAKKSAKNNFEIYDRSLSEIMENRFEMEHDLRKAIAEGDIMVYYQPQINLATSMPCGAEALVRWKHEERGWISPEIFIPIAEESGLIHDLGLYVFDKCCMQAQKWKEAGLDDLRIAVNISASQLNDTHLPDLFYEKVHKCGLDPMQFELEITESHMIENRIKVIELLNALKRVGFKLAIDDFGTGYSSLSVIKSLPIYRLKIDKSFIMDLISDEDDRTIALTIIAMGKNLKFDVLAEGVESAQQLDFLRKNGCSSVQGFHFAKALSPEDFMEWYLSYEPAAFFPER